MGLLTDPQALDCVLKTKITHTHTQTHTKRGIPKKTAIFHTPSNIDQKLFPKKQKIELLCCIFMADWQYRLSE